MKYKSLIKWGIIIVAIYAVLLLLYYTTGIKLFLEMFQSMHTSFPILLIVALGGLISERSGVTNIALEGIMIMGAFLGIWFVLGLEAYPYSNFTVFIIFLVSLMFAIAVLLFTLFIIEIMREKKNKDKIKLNIYIKAGIVLALAIGFTLIIKDIQPKKYFIFLMAMMVGSGVGSVYAMIHAYAAVYLKSNQIISATALNIFAPAFSIFTSRFVRNSSNYNIRTNVRIAEVPILSKIPVIGELFFTNTYLTLYIALLLLGLVTIFLYKTKFGLRLRACGENPQSADSLGVNIYRTRFIAVTLSGTLAGMGGILYVLPSKAYSTTVAGFGFLALAVMIFGNWKPKGILYGALFFGFMRTLALYYREVPFLADLELTSDIYNAIPFVATLIILAIFSKKSNVPKALGQIYDQGKR
ncbi:MAG: ABC transporter permease [Tenericutes bacterium]|nr:ABC transporter permease [Mycoplasmatota bacterium]